MDEEELVLVPALDRGKLRPFKEAADMRWEGGGGGAAALIMSRRRGYYCLQAYRGRLAEGFGE